MTQSSYQKISLTGDIKLNWPFSFQEGPSISDINDISTSQIQIPCYAATTNNLVALYAYGTAGVGATLTNNGDPEVFSVDGVRPSPGARVLVKNQTTFSNWHGIYVVTNSGSSSTNWVLTRATDYDTTNQIKAGDIISITNGNTNANTKWAQTANVNFVIGYGSLTFINKNNGWTITLPDATLASSGQNILFNNISTNPFLIMNNDGITNVITVSAGQSYYLYLSDTSTPNGVWSPIPFGGGISAINSIEVNTTGETLIVTNGSLTPPGGKITLETVPSISNLVSNVSSIGLLTLTGVNPSEYTTRDLVAGKNIVVKNEDGVNGNPVISLADSLNNISSIFVGDLQLSNNIITSNVTNGGVQISSVGTGKVNINGLQIDSNSNITGINNLTLNGALTIAGSFSSPTAPKVVFNFRDTKLNDGNKIEQFNQYNVASQDGVTGSNGTYTIKFATALGSANYALSFASGCNIKNGIPLANHVYWTVKDPSYLTITIIDGSGVLVEDIQGGVSGVIYLPG